MLRPAVTETGFPSYLYSHEKIFSFLLPGTCVIQLCAQGDTLHISSDGKLKPMQVNRDIWHCYKKVTIQLYAYIRLCSTI